jgi:hypothetical protein
VKRVAFIPLAILLELNALRIVLLVFSCRIVAALALRASKRNQGSHGFNLSAACLKPAV